MMITTDVKPRTGLNTSTGQRNAPRMAGGMPIKQVNSFELPSGTLQERLDALMAKEKEKETLAKITEKNKNFYLSGGTPEASVGGSASVLDGVAERTRQAFNNIGGDTNRLGAEKGLIQNNIEANAKARGLGQYSGQSDSTVTNYGFGQDTPFKARMALQAAADDAAQAASLEAQRNNNRISAKTAADAASAADNAYSQRYAAAQAADAQKFASTMQMFGNITQPGAYKYWGG